jgi:protein SCO1/2
MIPQSLPHPSPRRGAALRTTWALVLLLTALTGCHPESDSRPPCCRELKPGAVYPDRSIYQLESRWTSDVGREIRLGVLAGDPQVVALVFTSCEFACPIIVNDMKRLAAALPTEVRDRTGFVLVSFDPERDTPERLREFRHKMNLPTRGWTLLRGAPDDVRELAALLGVNYRKDARGQYAHSNLLTLLNAQGEVVFQQPGLNLPPEEMVARIRQLH